MANSYNNKELVDLAILAAADYAASCSGPTIRGRNGEKSLRGKSLEEVALKNGLSLEEAAKVTVDLSTASWEELSPHWREVNIDSARGMVALMGEMGGEDYVLSLNLGDPAVREDAGDKLHQLWLEQPANSWALGGPLDVPFSELPYGEQEKDLQQLRSLQKWLRGLSR